MCSSGGSAESSAGAGACARGLTLVQTHLLLQLCQALVARWSNNHIFSLQMATESTKRGHSIGVGGRGTHHAGTRAQAIPIVAACLCPCLCIGLLLAMGAGQAEVLSGTDRCASMPGTPSRCAQSCSACPGMLLALMICHCAAPCHQSGLVLGFAPCARTRTLAVRPRGTSGPVLLSQHPPLRS